MKTHVLTLLVGLALGVLGLHLWSDHSASERTSETDALSARDARIHELEEKLLRLSDAMSGLISPTLEGSAPDPVGAQEGQDQPEPTMTRLEALAAAQAALQPDDYRKPLPAKETINPHRWKSIGLVQKTLRKEDETAWIAWATEHAVEDIAKQMPPRFDDYDKDWLRDLFTEFYAEQAARLLKARSFWENKDLPAGERQAAYRDWLKKMNAAAEQRNNKLKDYLHKNHGQWWLTKGVHSLMLPS